MKKFLFTILFLINFSVIASDTLTLEIKDVYDLASYGNLNQKTLVLKGNTNSVDFKLKSWAELPHLTSYNVSVKVDAVKVSEGRYAVQFVKKIFLNDGRTITVSDKFLAVSKGKVENFSDSYWDLDNLALRQENTISIK